MSDRVHVRFHKATVQSEADVSLPHVIVENDGDTAWVSRALAFRLIQLRRVEEVEDGSEEPKEHKRGVMPALTWPVPSGGDVSLAGSWPSLAPPGPSVSAPVPVSHEKAPEAGVSDADVANSTEETPAPRKSVLD